MRLGGRLFFITIIYCSARLCETTERKDRHLLSIFGFRISGTDDLRTKPFWYSPVIIIPSLAQNQNANHQQAGDVLERLTLEMKDTKFSNDMTTEKDSDSIVFTESTRGVYNEPILAEETINENFRSGDNITDEIQNNSTLQQFTEVLSLENTTTPMDLETNTTESVTELEVQTTLRPEGPYSTPLYNNDFIKTLTLTTPFKDNVGSMLSVPENNENWKNFDTGLEEHVNLYDNRDNRWRKFASSIRYVSSQFKPIAGLYHDGFLHRPLPIKRGFIPSRQIYE